MEGVYIVQIGKRTIPPIWIKEDLFGQLSYIIIRR